MISRRYWLGILMLMSMLILSSALAESFHDTAENKDIDQIKRLIAQGAAVNTSDKGNHEDTVELLRRYEATEGNPRVYPVLYGTNRQFSDPTDTSQGYSSKRDTRIHYGICLVSIPESHNFGSIGSSWWQRWIMSKDDRLKKLELSSFGEKSFWQTLVKINQKYPDRRTVLVYIHGYNMKFEEAILRAAQIGFDLKIDGITVLYSWPSIGSFLWYKADSTSIQASAYHIAQFLSRLVRDTGTDRVHIIAHSMGSLGLLRAIQRITQQVNTEDVKFGQIFLAASDVDTEIFKGLSYLFPNRSNRTTLYVSRNDKALGLSDWLHDYPRVGFAPPITIVEGIDTVEVTNLKLTTIGHGYFAEESAVLHDIDTLIRNNLSPQRRIRLRPKRTQNNLKYWIFK